MAAEEELPQLIGSRHEHIRMAVARVEGNRQLVEVVRLGRDGIPDTNPRLFLKFRQALQDGFRIRVLV